MCSLFHEVCTGFVFNIYSHLKVVFAKIDASDFQIPKILLEQVFDYRSVLVHHDLHHSRNIHSARIIQKTSCSADDPCILTVLSISFFIPISAFKKSNPATPILSSKYLSKENINGRKDLVCREATGEFLGESLRGKE